MPEPKAVKTDVPYITCQVCELLAKHAHRQVKAKRDELAPGKKLLESDVLELVERLSNPAKDDGDWISKVDLVESGSVLKVVEMDETGKCGVECKTVQRAAEQIVEYTDTDLAELLWQGKLSRAQLTKWLCREATKSCVKKTPPLPANRKPGPDFQVADPQEAQMAKMMESMKEMGMGGKMYDRESMMQKYMGGYDDEPDLYEDLDLPEPVSKKASASSTGSAWTSAQEAMASSTNRAAGGSLRHARAHLNRQAYAGRRSDTN
ncbi:hypothetical protein WJX73_005789 [Symbiochloris irregularis]|uniref:Saposin B-type domain-containing protein n=1 Tax=Symbiochloris irregularis TaxID=706552 RepID=A0AAW1PLR5_9CHLO